MAKSSASKETKKFYSGTGRRKRAIARVWLYDTKGEITINGESPKDLFNAKDTLEYIKPFHAVGISHPQAKFSATIKVEGGGKTSRIDAIRLGIARALVEYDENFRSTLRTNGLLTRDSRIKERKKPYFKKARKKPQYSKR